MQKLSLPAPIPTHTHLKREWNGKTHRQTTNYYFDNGVICPTTNIYFIGAKFTLIFFNMGINLTQFSNVSNQNIYLKILYLFHFRFPSKIPLVLAFLGGGGGDLTPNLLNLSQLNSNMKKLMGAWEKIYIYMNSASNPANNNVHKSNENQNHLSRISVIYINIWMSRLSVFMMQVKK